MRKKSRVQLTKFLIIGVPVAVVIVIVLMLWSAHTSRNSKTEETQAVSASAAAQSNTEDGVGRTLEEIPCEEPSMQGHAGYFEFARQDGTKTADIDAAATAGIAKRDTGKTLETGHHIYAVTDADGITRYAIISGTKLVYLDNNVYVPYEHKFILREESTGKRVQMFDTQAEYDAAVAAWDAGQAILAGGECEQGTVVLNGSLLSDCKVEIPVSTKNEPYVSLRALAEAYSRAASYDEVGDLLTVHLCNGVVFVPTTMTGGMFSDYIDTKDGRFLYTSFAEPAYSEWVIMPDESECVMPISLIERMFGWRAYTDGTVYSVVTDPLDDTGLFAYAPSQYIDVITITTINNGDGTVTLVGKHADGTEAWRETESAESDEAVSFPPEAEEQVGGD